MPAKTVVLPLTVQGGPPITRFPERAGWRAWLARKFGNMAMAGFVLISVDDARFVPKPHTQAGYHAERALLFAWKDVTEIDVQRIGGRVGTLFAFVLVDGTQMRLLLSRPPRHADVFELLGFVPHRSPAWHGRTRWARPGVEIDWNTRRDSFDIPASPLQPWPDNSEDT